MNGDTILCRTPSGGTPTRIPRWKFEAVATAIHAAVHEAGAQGLRFKDLPDAVDARLSHKDRAKLGSIMWHVTTVKLELEVQGRIARLPKASPQRLVLGSIVA